MKKIKVMTIQEFNKTIEMRNLSKEVVGILESEFEKAKKKAKRRGILSIVLGIIIFILLILLCKKCDSVSTLEDSVASLTSLKPEVKTLTAERDSVQWLLDDEREKGYFLNHEETEINGQKGTFVSIIEKCSCRGGEKELFIPEKVRTEYLKVKVPAESSCDSIEAENNTLKMEVDFLEDVLEVAMDSLNKVSKKSIGIVLVKTTPNDTSVVARKDMEYREMLNRPLPSLPGIPDQVITGRVINEHTSMAEYYRAKSEICFWTGLGSAVIAGGLYGITEAMGHPIYRDPPADNSAAIQKSNTIKGLRWTSAAFGLASTIQFTRAWRYHRLEGKFTIQTSYGVAAGVSAGVSVTIPEIK